MELVFVSNLPLFYVFHLTYLVRFLTFCAGWASSYDEAAAISIKAGTDMNCGMTYTSVMPEAINKSLVSIADIDAAIFRSLLARFEVGEFDPPEKNPFTKIPFSVVGSAKHLNLAREVSRKSIVLLKNDEGILPLTQEKYKTIAVIGPNANDSLVLLGNYHGIPAFNNVSTPLMALHQRMSNHSILFAAGVDVVTGDGAWGFNGAIDVARKADVVVMFLGSSSKGTFEGITNLDTVEKESLDRKSLELPGLQSDLVKAVTKHSGNDIVVVLINGGPIAIEDLLENPRVKGIVQAWYPGQAGGQAIVDVLSGQHSPSGRLPVTIYAANYTSQIKATNMDMRTFPGRTYKYLQVRPLFPFGFGLSYTTFKYSHLSISTSHNSDGHKKKSHWAISLKCTNTGKFEAGEVVLLFVSFKPTAKDLIALGQPPFRELKAFQRLSKITPGDTQIVTFKLTDEDFSLTAVSGNKQLTHGKWHIEIGVGSKKAIAEIIV